MKSKYHGAGPFPLQVSLDDITVDGKTGMGQNGITVDGKMSLAEIERAIDHAADWDELPRLRFWQLPAELAGEAMENTADAFRTAITEHCESGTSSVFERIQRPDFAEKIGSALINTVWVVERLTPLKTQSVTFGCVCLTEENFMNAWENALGAVLPNRKKKQAAENAGAVILTGGRQITITDKKYQYALSPLPDAPAHITRLETSFAERLVFKDGKLSLLESGIDAATIKKATSRGREAVNELDLPLLRQIYTAAFRSAQKNDKNTVTVYLPNFCREMGINIQKSKASVLFEKLNKFQDCIGVMENGNYWRLLTVLGYNEEENTLTLAVPYILQLFGEIRKNNQRELKSGGSFVLPGHSMLIHSDIAKERNKAAVEIVTRIIAGLQQRGALPDASLPQNANKIMRDRDVITYAITFQSLIEDIPLLYDRLENSAGADKNKQLKRAFEKAYELLRVKTDISAYYVDLNVKERIPTVSELGKALVITHYGESGSYKK